MTEDKFFEIDNWLKDKVLMTSSNVPILPLFIDTQLL